MPRSGHQEQLLQSEAAYVPKAETVTVATARRPGSSVPAPLRGFGGTPAAASTRDSSVSHRTQGLDCHHADEVKGTVSSFNSEGLHSSGSGVPNGVCSGNPAGAIGHSNSKLNALSSTLIAKRFHPSGVEAVP